MIECIKQLSPLFAQSQEINVDATEHCDPLFRAETPGDFLLHFDHPKIALREIVIGGFALFEQNE